MATQQDLMQALRKADAAGDNQAAEAIARLIKTQGSVAPVEGIPTAQDLPSAQPAQTGSTFDTLAGAADIALGTGYSAGREAISGLAGIAMSPGGQGGQAVQAVQAAIPEYQMSRQGQEIIQGIAQKYQAAPDFVKSIVTDAMNLGGSLGESVFQATGSPLAATAAQVLPGALEATTGVRGGRIAAEQAARAAETPVISAPIEAIEGVAETAATEAKRAIQQLSPTKRKITEALESGSSEGVGAGFQLTPKGLVQEAPLEQAALKQGWSEGTIAALKNASPADKKAMAQMTQLREQAKLDEFKGVGIRPARVAGDALLERFNTVKTANKKAGQAVDREARALAGQAVEGAVEIADDFRRVLDEDLAVSLTPEGNLNFFDSIIEDNPAAKKAISDVVKVMKRGKPGEPITADRLHFIKKKIDDAVTFGKSAEGLAGQAESALKDLRFSINSTLRENFPEYGAANQAYSETIDVLDTFQDIMGRKVNLSGERANEAVGRNLRKVMSNYNSREQLQDVIQNIEEVAVKHGGEFDTNVELLAFYADALDKRFGKTGATTFGGEIQAAIETAMGGKTGLTAAAIDKLASTAEELRGINDEGAFKAMNELLK